ncbi:MAG: RNA recognition motif domain-containing protein [Akkermansiaceae bacterium]
MPAPELTFWQKLLKAIGLYKEEPSRPPRPERRPEKDKPKREPRKSKTRDARTSGGSTSEENSDAKRPSKRKRENRDRKPRGGDPSTVENRRVYVGNLSYDTTESDLEELFKGVGAVRRIEIVYNRKTHRSKGYGFVEMIDIDEAKRTVEVLHDQHFMGRQLTVSGAKSKDHETAESEEGTPSQANKEVPPLAPKNPEKEEVLDLIDETKPEGDAEPEATVTTEEVKTEVATEEFSPESDEEKAKP